MIKMLQRSRFKIKYLLLLFAFAYIIMCQSCMTLRMTPKETGSYFKAHEVTYESKTTTIGKHQLHYIQTGKTDRPTLFFVHGSPGSWDAYKKFLTDSLLLSKYRMIAVDRPGFGYSDFGEAKDLETQAQLLEKLVQRTDNHKPITLIGHSLGGPIVVKMAIDAPAQFKHLVVLAGSVDPEAETPEIWRRVLMMKPIRYLIPGALRTSNDELWWLKNDLLAMKAMLKEVRSKVTIVHGTKDQLVPYHNAKFMQAAFYNSVSIDLISIENAGHLIPWEHFDRIRDLLYQL